MSVNAKHSLLMNFQLLEKASKIYHFMLIKVYITGPNIFTSSTCSTCSLLTTQVFIDIHNEIRDAKKASSEANVYDAFIPIDIKEDVARTYMVYLGGHGKRDVTLYYLLWS